MIRFKCIYCGQRIVACDEGRGKKGKCPKCAHPLVVPHSTKGRPSISPVKEEMPDRTEKRVPVWQQDSGFSAQDAEQALTELYKESFHFLIPTYDELSLFLMAVTFILLYATNGRMREQIRLIMATPDASWLYLVALAFVGALGLCIYHVFTTREKTDLERTIMLAFAVLMNLVTGIVASVYTLTNALIADWLLIFAVWNIVNAILLVLLVCLRVVDEECISDRDATLPQVVLGLIAVLIIFALCHFVFKLHWSLTFSICIIYTTSFDKALQNVLPGFTADDAEQ